MTTQRFRVAVAAGVLLLAIAGVVKAQGVRVSATPWFNQLGVARGSLTTPGDLKFTGNAPGVTNGTSDGADTNVIELNGGGGKGAARGASLVMYGNENAATGRIVFTPGNVANSDFTINDSANGFQTVHVDGDVGNATFTSSSVTNAVLVNSTAANGSYLHVARSGTGSIIVGNAEAVDAALGTNNDGIVKGSTANLYLEAAGTDGLRSMTAYNNTDAGAANVVILSDGSIQRSTSSARYKTNIERLTDWRFLLGLEPVTFTSVTAPNGKRYGGLIAENVAAVAPEYAVVNAKGEPDEVAYGHLVAPIIAALQDLAAENAALRARIDALEAK
jgi:hypothetical protein